MTPDDPENAPDDAEGVGVLGEHPDTSTSRLNVLGGAISQFDIVLPTGDDELADDDVVDDEVPLGVLMADAAADAEADVDPITVESEVIEVDDDALDDPEVDDDALDVPDADAEETPDPEPVPDTPVSWSDAVVAAAAEAAARRERSLVPPEPSRVSADAASPLASSSSAASAAPAAAPSVPEMPATAPPVPSAPAEAVARSTVAPTPGTQVSTRTAASPALRTRTGARAAVPTSRRIEDLGSERESADLLTADRLLDAGRRGAAEPEGLWQHFVYSVTGGHVNLGDGKRARARKELTGRIAAPLDGTAKFVPVLSRKGGVGKTTITTLLGMALADARDDRIIAVDANPDRGTLADRISSGVSTTDRTVRDLVERKAEIDGYNDVSAMVARDHTRLDVLASDADPRVSEAFNDRDYADVADVAAHYYSIVLTDTGTGMVHSVMGRTLTTADQIVVVSGLSVDEARLASETLTWLESNGHGALARNAVVVLNSARPGTPLVRAGELRTHFATRVRAVVDMPYDPLIGTGSAIVFAELKPETRQAARELARVVVDGLRARVAA